MTSPTSQFIGADSLILVQTRRHKEHEGNHGIHHSSPYPLLSRGEEIRRCCAVRIHSFWFKHKGIGHSGLEIKHQDTKAQRAGTDSSLLTLPSPLKRRGESPSSRLPGVGGGLIAHCLDQVSGSSFVVIRRALVVRQSPGSDRVTISIVTILRRGLRLSTCIILRALSSSALR